MISVTFDSNVYVSALIYPGPPARLLGMAKFGLIRVDISDEILDETLGVLRDRFDWPGYLLQGWRSQFASFTNRVTPTERLDLVTADPDDDRILECAKAAGSDYIVSADKHLLRMGMFGEARIVRALDFLDILAKRGRDKRTKQRSSA